MACFTSVWHVADWQAVAHCHDARNRAFSSANRTPDRTIKRNSEITNRMTYSSKKSFVVYRPAITAEIGIVSFQCGNIWLLRRHRKPPPNLSLYYLENSLHAYAKIPGKLTIRFPTVAVSLAYVVDFFRVEL